MRKIAETALKSLTAAVQTVSAAQTLAIQTVAVEATISITRIVPVTTTVRFRHTQCTFKRSFATFRDDDANSKFRQNNDFKKAHHAFKKFKEWSKDNTPSLETMLYMAQNLLDKKETKLALFFIKELGCFEIEKEAHKGLLMEAMDQCLNKGKNKTKLSLVPEVRQIATDNNIDIKTAKNEEPNVQQPKKIWKEKARKIDVDPEYKHFAYNFNRREAKKQRKFEMKDATKKPNAKKKQN